MATMTITTVTLGSAWMKGVREERNISASQRPKEGDKQSDWVSLCEIRCWQRLLEDGGDAFLPSALPANE